MKNISVLLLFLVGFNSYAAIPKDELRIAVSQELDTLNPLLWNMLASVYSYDFVGRGLLYMNTDGEWKPQLAKSIPSFENGGAKFVNVGPQKKVEAIWEIKDEAKWGDGTALTCSDFAFALEVAANLNVSVPERSLYEQFEKITWAPETPKRCTFLYKEAKWNFFQIGRLKALPRHLEEPIYKKYGDKKEGYERNTLYVTKPTTPGLYNGPYVVSELKMGQHVMFKPNKYFYGPTPKISKVVIKVIPNTGTIEANLLSGSVNVTTFLGFTLDQAVSFEKRKTEDFKIHYVPSTTYEHINMNLENPILADLKVRKALLIAIDRGELNTALFEGKSQVAHHPIVPIDPWYTEDPKYVSLYKYSSRDAQKLLEEAGWKRGKDGIREKGGKRLSLDFATTAGNKIRETTQQYLQDKWKQVGVEVVIKNVPAKVFFGDFLKKREFTGLVMFAWTTELQANPEIFLHSKYIPSAENSFSGRNVSAWKNKEVDKILGSLDQEFSLAERKKKIQKVLKIFTADVPDIPLFYRTINAVVPAQLKEFKLSPHGYSEANEVENWTM